MASLAWNLLSCGVIIQTELSSHAVKERALELGFDLGWDRFLLESGKTQAFPGSG